MKTLDEYVRVIPDFPQKGVMFRDITSVLQDADGFKLAVDELLKLVEGSDFDVVVGVESRGFIFGAPMAYALHKPLVLVRKKGKLPGETIAKEYALEYGTATVEIHKDAIQPGQKAIVVDDLIATGGTLKAAAELVEDLGGSVAKIISLVELKGFDGRGFLSKYDVDTVLQYEGK